jgi:hypothetical protein
MKNSRIRFLVSCVAFWLALLHMHPLPPSRFGFPGEPSVHQVTPMDALTGCGPFGSASGQHGEHPVHLGVGLEDLVEALAGS